MSITYADFEKACEALQERWEKFGADSNWLEVRLHCQFGIKFLRIKKEISPALMQIETADPVETPYGLEYEDEDGLAVVKSEVAPILSCDVVHSVSYQVPVLYFQLCNMHWHLPPSLDIIHSILVPDFHKMPVRDFGILGALSTSDHPVTGLPSFFIHPCQTQAAMASLHIDQFGQPDDYLLAWIGIIGSTVGLSVPIQMASQSVEGTLEN